MNSSNTSASSVLDDNGGWDPDYINLNADLNGEPSVIDLPHPDKPIGLRAPCRIYVVGPSQSGKTRMIQRLMNEMRDWFDVSFKEFFYLFPASELTSNSRQEFIQPLQQICERNQIPFRNISGQQQQFFDQLERMDKQHRICVIDDMQTEVTDNPKWADVFSRLSHQKFLSIVLISQNFYSGQAGRDIRLNVTEFILWSTLREKHYLSRIGADILGRKGGGHFIEKCFEWLDNNVPNSYDRYLLIDVNRASDPHLPKNYLRYFGCKTNLFKDERTGQRQVVYFPCSSL
jgi:hypothetical protein